MNEKPILFNGPMVRAILDGRKTQTRRVMKDQPSESFSPSPLEMYSPSIEDENGFQEPGPEIFGCYDKFGEDEGYKCPYGPPGNRLWVKETFKVNEPPSGYIYRATDEASLDPRDSRPWKPSIFMPRMASRITLEMTSIRVERVAEISGEDAIAEGIEPHSSVPSAFKDYSHPESQLQLAMSATASYKSVWDSINAERGFGWDKNPWVWVIEFKRTA